MPTKKGKTKGRDAKKRGKVSQKQKQSQVQKVVVNIHKTASKPKTKEIVTKISSSSYTTPIYQPSAIPYPSYQRQAEAVPISIPIETPVALKPIVPRPKLSKQESAEIKSMFKEDVASEMLKFHIPQRDNISSPAVIEEVKPTKYEESELIEAQRRKINFFTPYTPEYNLPETDIEGVPLVEAQIKQKRKYVKSGKYKKKPTKEDS